MRQRSKTYREERLSRLKLTCLVASVTALLTCSATTHAQTSSFFSGKQLTILVNFTAGGPTDTEARIVSRHIAKHIAGRPTVVVRNMGGAGGAIGANWLGQIAAPDGLTLSLFTGMALPSAMGDTSVKVDLTKMPFVAAGPSIGGVVFARTDTGGGLKSSRDLLKLNEFWAGGLSAESSKDIAMRMQLDLLGVKYKYLTGFAGTNELRHALEIGEIHLINETLSAYKALIQPGMVARGEAIPLWYQPVDKGQGLTTSPEAADTNALPYHEYYRQLTGVDPSGPIWDGYRFINKLTSTFQRLFLMPPGSPPEAVAILQAAMVSLQKDQEFLTESMDILKFEPQYDADDQTAELFRASLNTDPKVKAFVRDFIEKSKMSAKR